MSLAKLNTDGYGDIEAIDNTIEVNVRKTFRQPVDRVFANAKGWFEQERRARLKHFGNRNSLKCVWSTDNSIVAVDFKSKGKNATEMTVRHKSLQSESDKAIMQNFWTESIPQMVESF